VSGSTTNCAHCAARASLLAAALLVLEGVDPDQAWRRLTRAPGLRVPDTDEQRRWIARLPFRAPVDSRAARRFQATEVPGE
jgi:hypothetical protein